MKHKRALVSGCIVAVVIAAVGVTALRGSIERSSWQRRVATGYTPPGAARTASGMPAAYWTRHDRVMGDLLQRHAPWGAAELEELRGYVSQPMNWSKLADPRAVPTDEVAYEYLIWLEAVNAIGARLASKAPIDPALRPAFESEVTNLLVHTVARVRNQALAEVTEMGLLDHPGPVRTKVESMRTDPDPEVAANAVRQLEWRDLLVKKGVVK